MNTARYARTSLIWKCILATLLLGGLPLAGPPLTRAASQPPTPPAETAPTAEVTFPTPTAFAVVLEPGTKVRRLYGVGEPVGAAPGGPVVERVDPGALTLRLPHQPTVVRVAVGAELPGVPGRRLSAIVRLEGVEYQYLPTPGAVDPEPQVLALQGGRAVLAVAVPLGTSDPAPVPSAPAPLPAPEYTLATQQRLDGPRLEQVKVRPTGRDSYALNPADVQWAMEHAGQVLQEAWGTVRPLLSAQEGLRFRVESPLADGVLGPAGFQVHSPKLAERAGLQAGDIVHSVNGQPVTGFPDLVRLYTEVKRNPHIAVVEVGLERQGQRLTKTYRIR